MPESIISLMISYAIIFGLPLVVILVIFKKFKPNMGFKEFKNQLLNKTVYDELKGKTDQHGYKIKKGKLLLGLHEVCWIDRWIKLKGKFSTEVYDSKTKETMVLDDKDEDYDFLMLRAKNRKIFWRLLGLKKVYYILEAKDDHKKPIYKYDDVSHKFIFPESMDLRLYANVWVMSNSGIEYINDISIKRMNERTQMYLENLPDKVSHLEIEQAKKERMNRVLADLEKGKYDNIKKADDTTVT